MGKIEVPYLPFICVALHLFTFFLFLTKNGKKERNRPTVYVCRRDINPLGGGTAPHLKGLKSPSPAPPYSPIAPGGRS